MAGAAGIADLERAHGETRKARNNLGPKSIFPGRPGLAFTSPLDSLDLHPSLGKGPLQYYVVGLSKFA